MPGQPIFRALCRTIEERGGDEYVFGRLLDGETFTAIAKSLNVSVNTLYRWKDHSPARKAAFEQMRTDRAHTFAEGSVDIADELVTKRDADGNPIPPSREDIAAAKQRIKVRQWLSGVTNSQYRKADTTIVNIGALHLDALRKFGTPDALPGSLEALPLGEAVEVEEEVVEASQVNLDPLEELL